MEKNFEEQILEIIYTLFEAGTQILNLSEKKQFAEVEKIAEDMIDAIESIYPYCVQYKEQNIHISAPLSCENLVYSLQNIIRMCKTRSTQLISKIEFELIPIIQDFHYDFYFFTQIYGDKEKEKYHYENEYAVLTSNQYIDQSISENNYKYDVSIAIFAYNKLEYTKLCVESVLKYTPSHINYELILVNNGSNDETQAYFESLSPTKLFTLKSNSLNIMAHATSRIVEGKYLVAISNDVVVTENYLDNLLTCIESDSRIAMVVPTTPNVSNFQTIPFKYDNLDEMFEFSKQNNVSNPLRWEERIRLCNPLTLYRSDAVLSSQGVGVNDKYFVYGEFADDAISLKLRRNGYKMILAKDCFCHHFGSVTLRENQIKNNTLQKSRELFLQRHEIDPYSYGMSFDPILMENFPLSPVSDIKILGVNSGFGSNILKVKELYKEQGNLNVQIYHITNDIRFNADLIQYSKEVNFCESQDKLIDVYKDIKFDYIFIEDDIENILNATSINQWTDQLSDTGLLIICARTKELEGKLHKLNAGQVISGIDFKWYCWKAQ